MLFVQPALQWLLLSTGLSPSASPASLTPSLSSPLHLQAQPLDHTASIVAISQTINLFAILVDSAQYDALGRVFTTSAIVDFDSPGGLVLRGLPAIIELLRGLKGSFSQHLVATQYVEMLSATTADASTYLIGHFFDDKDAEEPNWTEYGRYETDMVLTEQGWMIQVMNFTIRASFGHDPRTALVRNRYHKFRNNGEERESGPNLV